VYWVALYLLAAVLLRGTGICASNAVARLNPVAPCAALVAAAQASKIPLEQIDAQTGTDRLDPGDSITGLITMFEKGGRRTQWLLYLEVVASDEKEKAQKPPPPMVLYSSFGGTQTCASVPAFAVVRTLGPFVDSTKRGKPAKAPEKTARFALNKGFLGLGLHHAAAAFRSLEQGPIRGSWGVKHTPFNEAEVAKGRELAARLKITPDQERALMSAIPALLSYFEVVQNAPGLSDILYEIVDLPSAWSLVRNAGIKSIGLRFGKGAGESSAASWGLAESAPVYDFPLFLELNEQRALNLKFVVTSPNPPLLACAGVVGMLAEHPVDTGKYLTLRIVSARIAGKK